MSASSQDNQGLTMFRMVLLIVVGAFVVVCSAPGGEWSGFRGLARDGRSDATDAPLTWSPSQNLAWRTAIRGRGHSSPIVTEDAVYVTTSYPRAEVSSARKAASYSVLALAVLAGLFGLRSAVRSLHAYPGRRERVLQHLRFLLFHQFLIGTLITVVVGRRLLNPGGGELRDWTVSILVALSCLILISLAASIRSRQQIVAGLLSLALVAWAWFSLPDRGLFFALHSSRGVIATGMPLLPALVAAAILLAYGISIRRRPLPTGGPEAETANRPALWPYAITAIIGCVTALVPFFLILYRAAGWQMPDRYLWSGRLAADVRWPWIVVAGVLLVAGLLWNYRRPDRVTRTRISAPAGGFIAAALLLAVAFHVAVEIAGTGETFARAVVCLDRQTGRIIWTCEGLEARSQARGRTVTDATPTPVTDGQRIYAYFGDGLMAVDTAGQLLWKRPEQMFASHFGVGASPVLADGVLVLVNDVDAGRRLPSTIMAFDPATGETLWMRERVSHRSYAAYDTPLIRSVDGTEEIIVHGWHDVRAYDLRTGTERWSYPITHEAKHLVAGPISDGQRLYLTGARHITALELSKVGAEEDPVVWSAPVPAEKSSTPVVVGGLLFSVNEVGRACCIDTLIGRILWSERLKGRFYASVIAIGDHVLFTNEAGQTTVVAADKEFRVVAINDLEEAIYASPVPVDTQLFIRTTEHLYCFETIGNDNHDSRESVRGSDAAAQYTGPQHNVEASVE